MAEDVVDIYDALPFDKAFAAARAKGLQQFPYRGKWYTTEVAPNALNQPQSTATPVNPFTLMPSAGGGPQPAPQAPDVVDLIMQNQPRLQQAAPSPGYDMGFSSVGAPNTARPMMGQPTGGVTVSAGGPTGPTPTAAPTPVDMSTMGTAMSQYPSVQAPGAGDMMNKLIPKEMNVGPAKTPEEAQQRVSGWQQFFDKVRSDPNLLMALVRFGSEMIQPIQPGQTLGGHFGMAVQGGMDYLGQLQNQQSVRNLQMAEAQRLGAGTEQVQRQTAAGLPEAQTSNVRATTEHTQAGTLQTQAQTRKIDEEVKLVAAEARIKQLTADSQPKVIEAQLKKLQSEGLLDDAKAREVQAELDAGRPAAAVELLKAHAEYFRQGHQQMKAQAQRYEDLVDAYTQSGYSRPDAVRAANRDLFAGGALRSTAELDADAQLQDLQDQYQATMADPKNKKKNMTFSQFVADDLQYGGSSGLPPATKALIKARITRMGGSAVPAPAPGQRQQAPSPAPVPGAAAAPTAKPAPPAAAIEYLKKHPELADQFREKYGVDPRQYLQ